MFINFVAFKMNWEFLSSIYEYVRVVLDIGIVWLILYYILKIFRNNSRTMQIFKGIVLIIIVKIVADFLKLSTLSFLLDWVLQWGPLAVIVIFQQEIRSLLERMGTSPNYSKYDELTGDEKHHLINEISTALIELADSKTGALITIEQGVSLIDYIRKATRLDSQVSSELLRSIFVPTTPLHDGGVIIQGNKIACAAAFYEPTTMEMPARFGARHRAAVGLSEVSDAITVVVSEETGSISIAQHGKLTLVGKEDIFEYLLNSFDVPTMPATDLSNLEKHFVYEDKSAKSITDIVRQRKRNQKEGSKDE